MREILRNLAWIEELLPPDIEAAPKNGGMAYYLDMKMVLLLVEKADGTHEHKGVTYPFEFWNGCIIPVEQRKQSAFFLKYSFLENHPMNKNWLYIPADSENFEEDVRQFLRELTKRNPLLGVPVKLSSPASAKEKDSVPKKKTAKKVKTDKKRENSFITSMLSKKISRS